MAGGQSLVHVHFVAEFLTTMPENLHSVKFVELKFAKHFESVCSPKH